MLNIEIHVPCKTSECLLSKMNTFQADVDYLAGKDIFVSLTLHENNRLGLGKLYNSILDGIDFKSKPVDYVFLMHSDVSFSLKEVVERVVSVGDKYDLIGFAGAKKVNLGISPLTWFTASKEMPEKRYGKVTQNYLGRGLLIESFFNEKDPNTMDTEVACIDGLCLVLTKSCLKSGIRFDERFLTDFYDLDFCLEAVIHKKMKIGCIVVPVYHDSVGESVLTKKFLEVEKIFRDKWGLKIRSQ